MTPNSFDRQALVEAYIDRLLDNMSTKDLLQIVGDQMEENITSYTDEELISEVESYYPDLLDPDLLGDS
jgi:hypothetical protein